MTVAGVAQSPRDGTAGGPPVEYAVAVERYLAAAPLSAASRRVYRISLCAWAWALVGRPLPEGAARRGAAPPVVPLGLLDQPAAEERLLAALCARAAAVGSRTVRRELAALRSAVAWWHERGWLRRPPRLPAVPPSPEAVVDGDAYGDGDAPATAPREPGSASVPGPVPGSAAPLSDAALRALFALPADLREQTLWHLLYESGAPVGRLLALDVGDLDLPARRTRVHAVPQPVHWGFGAARLLPLLVAGRPAGPLFLTGRRAPATTPVRDRCPLTGRARLSYRRAAELFTAATRPLDPAGRGWTLRRLRAAGRAASR